VELPDVAATALTERLKWDYPRVEVDDTDLRRTTRRPDVLDRIRSLVDGAPGTRKTAATPAESLA
jgi:hypothetical protein